MSAASPAKPFEPPLARLSRRWLMPAIALGAAALAVYLAVVAAREGGAVGCAPGGWASCDAVLSSRWSRWLNVPVAIPAAGLYLVILIVACVVGWARPPALGAWALLRGLTLLAALAAAWFIALQGLALGAFCPYCTAVHLCGLALAGYAWLLGPASGRAGRGAAIAALAVVAVLILGQLLHRAPTHRLVAITASVALDPRREPILGSPSASHILIELFDYTCHHCRTLDRDLKVVMADLGGRVAIILQPVPLSGECNPHVPASMGRNDGSCALARLALAVWHTEPAAFPAYHDWLMTGERPPTEADARARAALLLGAEALATALADPQLERHLRHSINHYDRLDAGPLPKLILTPTRMLEGPTSGPEALRVEIERALGLTPPPQ